MIRAARFCSLDMRSILVAEADKDLLFSSIYTSSYFTVSMIDSVSLQTKSDRVFCRYPFLISSSFGAIWCLGKAVILNCGISRVFSLV